MEKILLVSLIVGLTSAFRGPHHPKSSVSHHHYSPQKAVKITQDAELLQDTTHLKEDMGPIADQLDFSKMTEHEIEFHYFKVHDVDNNTKLDGLEILHAVQHTLHEIKIAKPDNSEKSPRGDTESIEQKEYELQYIVELIDRVLEEDDLDNDGYLGYVEYVLGRQRDHVAQARRTDRQKLRK